MADGPIRRKTEKAVRDRAGVPVGLLYDETNDKTIMQRGTATGSGAVDVTGGTIDEVTNVTSVDLVDEVTNVTSVDTVDEVTNVTSVDLVDEVAIAKAYSWNDQTSTWVKTDYQPQDHTIVVPANIEEDIFHYAIHAGLGQECSHHIDVANSGIMSLSFTTPARGTQIHMLIEFDAESEATFYIRQDCTITATGTARTPTNRNQYLASVPTSLVIGGVSPHTTVGQVTVDATIDAAGIIRNGGGIGHHVGVGKFSGGSAQADHEYILKPASHHMFQFVNETTSNNEMYFNLTWFEVPDHV